MLLDIGTVPHKGVFCCQHFLAIQVHISIGVDALEDKSLVWHGEGITHGEIYGEFDIAVG